MRKIFSLVAVAIVAATLAGCMEHSGYAEERTPVNYAEPEMMPAPTQVAYNGGAGYAGPRMARQSGCTGPNSRFSEEAGGCVHRIADKGELNRLSRRMPIGTDPNCTGNPGYWTTVSGPQGPISIHRTCVYRH